VHDSLTAATGAGDSTEEVGVGQHWVPEDDTATSGQASLRANDDDVEGHRVALGEEQPGSVRPADKAAFRETDDDVEGHRFADKVHAQNDDDVEGHRHI
jgi:hypothetical protein